MMCMQERRNVSQNTTPPESDEPVVPVEPVIAAEPAARMEQPAAVPPAVEESTVGTGTSMALGCIAGTVVLIIFGLLFLFLSTLI